jgi:hypothetical protein
MAKRPADTFLPESLVLDNRLILPNLPNWLGRNSPDQRARRPGFPLDAFSESLKARPMIVEDLGQPSVGGQGWEMDVRSAKHLEIQLPGKSEASWMTVFSPGGGGIRVS